MAVTFKPKAKKKRAPRERKKKTTKAKVAKGETSTGVKGKKLFGCDGLDFVLVPRKKKRLTMKAYDILDEAGNSLEAVLVEGGGKFVILRPGKRAEFKSMGEVRDYLEGI